MFIYIALLIASAWVIYGSGRHMQKWIEELDNNQLAFGVFMGNGSFYIYMLITLVVLAMTPFWYLMPLVAGATVLQVIITKRALADYKDMMRDKQKTLRKE